MRGALLLLGVGASAVLASPQGGGYGGYGGYGGGGDDDHRTSTTPTSTTAPPQTSGTTTTGNVSSSVLLGMNGDTVCTPYLCVGALVNGTTVQYTLQSLGKADLGWMAMGFGQTMANSPMVIMWPNADGSVTLSQRQASAEVMPTVVPTPPRIATKQPALSSLTGSNPKLVYTIPANTDTQQGIIWAFGSQRPSSAAEDATLLQHVLSGPTKLNLGNTLAADSRDPTNPISSLSGSDTPPPSAGVSTPLLPYQKMIVAHAILCVVGFLAILPAGALLARWLRTFNPIWFKGHHLLQLFISLPIIVPGVALGFAAVHKAGAEHLSDDHMKWGLGIFVLYIIQLMVGEFIHTIKPKSWSVDKRRPPQNYFHAILGLLIIALAFYQVRTGYKTEWPKQTGRGEISNAANIVWYVWVVLIPVLYFGGLVFLRRQYKQERMTRPKHRDETSESEEMRPRYRDSPDHS
ncbi:hypothetical protein BXZ70DRAFT_156760 [Cristinia sonorae]|uniref:Cytochrome b561 domain-containing protein n=1 Tax=Cristinia sonorae TaxID=1940300 RepID=A0A8K0UNC8_9AGAR|nr:hypothetical protein BXZ70DRAFT_156760 [Cristinia sonorae]